jgi:hypothetical protein
MPGYRPGMMPFMMNLPIAPWGQSRPLAFVSAFNSLIKRKNRMTVNVRQPAKICRSSLKTGKDLPV